MLAWIAAPVVLLLLAITVIRENRRTLLARIRAEWSEPVRRARKMDAMAASHRSRVAVTGTGSLDDRTWDDLILDAVFTALDRTESTLGQHALYHRLRTSPAGDHLDAFDSLVSLMGLETAARERAQVALARLQDPHGYDLWWLARPGALNVRKWYVAFPALAAVTILLSVATLIWPGLLPALVATLGVNVALRITSDRHVGAVAAAFRQLAPLIATGQALAFLGGEEIDPIVRCLREEAPRLARLKRISRWVSSNPFMLPLGSSWPAIALNDGATVLYEYVNFLLPLDATAVYVGAGDLRARGSSLLRVMTAIGDVDAAVAVASFRAGTIEWARPRVVPPGAGAALTGLRHPLVVEAVPNSIVLQAGHGALVTGSNMSGKSTFLRTVGVNVVLAQTINTCLATSYEAPVFRVRSCIGRSDDLLSGQSYYIVEVQALLRLVRESAGPAPHLFLLDELFRGTNAVERIAAGQAVLKALVGDAGEPALHVVLAATHDGELVELVSERYGAYHFGDAVGPDGLAFDHRLRAGPATTRNAIALLQLNGAPESLVASALKCAAVLDRQRTTIPR